jgi:hypothetical protein
MAADAKPLTSLTLLTLLTLLTRRRRWQAKRGIKATL